MSVLSLESEVLTVDQRLRAVTERLVRRSRHVLADTFATFRADGMVYELPRIILRGEVEAGRSPRRIGIFAALHGDEPAGALGALAWLNRLVTVPEFVRGYEFYCYPVCNPAGLRSGRRENHAGCDLNREFWQGSALPEIIALEGELRRHAFAGVIALHADDTSPGVYGYSQGRPLNGILLASGLAAAERWLPRNRRARIDSFPARRGIIEPCFQGILAPPPEQTPRPFEVIFETPALAPLDRQIEATAAALDAMFTTLRHQNVIASDI